MVSDVFELQLTNEELALFKTSCAVIREHVVRELSLCKWMFALVYKS